MNIDHKKLFFFIRKENWNPKCSLFDKYIVLLLLLQGIFLYIFTFYHYIFFELWNWAVKSLLLFYLFFSVWTVAPSIVLVWVILNACLVVPCCVFKHIGWNWHQFGLDEDIVFCNIDMYVGVVSKFVSKW